MSQPKDAHRRHSQKNSFGYGSDKFRATKLWKQVVREFRERITQGADAAMGGMVLWRGPKRFSGAEAVEILTSFLVEKRESFGLKEVTEEKAAKFCEILLRDNTIAPAPENKNQKQFEVSKNAFYYFNDVSTSTLLGMSTDNLDKDNMRRVVTPKSCRNMTLRTSRTSLTSVEDVGDLDEKIVRDFALSRLLTLVEIPILEGILHIRSDDDGGSMFKTFENLFGGLKLALHLNSRSDSSSENEEDMSVDETSTDPWIISANQCLKVCRVPADSSSSRDILYRSVANAYKNVSWKRGTLISRHYDDVLKQISLLIARGRPEEESKALEACQCLCLLLPKETRGQLGALLHFLTVISTGETKMSNIEVARSVDTFAKFILPKEVQDHDHLMRFFLHHANSLLVCPKDFREQAYYRQTVLMHSYTEPKPEVTFCARISSEEYQKQALTATEQALYDALSSVVEDERMTDKEKCQWFEKFRLEYPKIYEARFPSMPK